MRLKLKSSLLCGYIYNRDPLFLAVQQNRAFVKVIVLVLLWHFRRVIGKLFRAKWKTVFSSGWTMEILTRASQHCVIAQHH